MLETNVWTKTDFDERLTWEEWKKRWAEVSNRTDALNLIHDIYSTSPVGTGGAETESERLCFLLELADSLKKAESQTVTITKITPEYALRDKALRVLKAHVFAWKHSGQYLLWLKYASPETFKKFLWFLRLDGPESLAGQHSLINDNDEDVERFAWEFCKALWNISPTDDWSKGNRETIRLMFESRAEALKIAYGIGRLLDLVPGQIDGYGSLMVRRWRRFDDKAIAVLKGFSTPYKDSDEAFLLGYEPEVALRLIAAAEAAIKKYLNREMNRGERKDVFQESRKEQKALKEILAA